MNGQPLSVCMIVKNEEHRLPRCLDSIRSLAAELIVVDTGSSDATAEIAASYGAKISRIDFSLPDFAAARNHALAQARGRWALVLDADETLRAGSAPQIAELTARDDNAGYYFQRLNHRPSPEETTTDYAVRLFPNRPAYRFRGRVHETIDDSILAAGGRLLRSGICLDHDFASDVEGRRRRNLWYIDILQQELAANPADCSRLVFLAAEYHQIGMFEKAAEITERIADLRPLDPQAHLHAGVYHLLYKVDRDRARADFMKALKLKPGYEEAQSFLSLLERQEAPS
jgi:glycosyltransferase involved in cell wall biosynthesis